MGKLQHAGGGIAAVVLNALLMCLPLLAFRQTKKRFGNALGYLSLPIYWLAFEQLHLTWDLTWPWLTLGNGFAAVPQWVQWYEYTGFLGGSAWVWAANLAVLFLIERYELIVNEQDANTHELEHNMDSPAGAARRPAKLGRPAVVRTRNSSFNRSSIFGTPLLVVFLVIVLPLSISYFIGANYQEKGTPAEVVVVQPNVDPYEEKFEGGSRFVPYAEQLTRLLTLSEQKLTPQTRLVIWPETALEESYWENTINSQPNIVRIRAWLGRHPGVALLTGITTVSSYTDKETASATARYRDDLGFYDVFNSGAYFADSAAPVAFYHKSRLVPGVEKIPPLLTSIISHIDLGGTVGSYGSQPERTVFAAPANAPSLRVAPLICYESIYGDFTAEYADRGATLLGLFTNDAWWHDSPGYHQLLRYGALRCIETRRDLARAANTGFTGFINQKGEVTQREKAWVPAASRGTVHLNEEVTFYARHGELLGHGTQLLAVLGILANVIFWRRR